MSLLDADDVAYLRGTQAEAYPTAVVLYAKEANTPDGMGGHTDGYPLTGVDLAVRFSMSVDQSSGGDVPQDLADQYQATDLVRVHAPITPAIKFHDRLVVPSPEGGKPYLVVSDGFTTAWTTSQILWAVEA